ncbi:MAG TPA: adenylyl cyclase, partial [Streptosporangiaceae bacterium]
MYRIARLMVSAALLGAAALTATAAGAEHASADPSLASLCPDAVTATFGPYVCVFTPSMSQADIQAEVNAIYAQQVDNEMGSARYALLFEPGTYGSQNNPLDIPVGYYTEVDGLGQDPSSVLINGGVTAIGKNGSGALDTFWRSVSNLTIHVVPTADGCHTGNEMWAVSQAAPMRRVDVKDFTTFMPYCETPNFASGGFVADSRLEGGALNGSQQQFYVRNSDLGKGWTNFVWNQVFSGDIAAPAQHFGGGAAYTTLAQTPVSKEKPYLYIDGSGAWNVFVPSAQTNSVGPTWANGHTAGTSIPLSQFFIATPSDSVSTINAALARGLNLLLTPGVYNVGSPIKVKRADTVVQGLGMATLTATNGNSVLATADVPGIDISGLIVDAGPVNSPVLAQIGSKNGNNGVPHNQASDPTALQDVFFRVGGPHVGKATVALEVNSDNT